MSYIDKVNSLRLGEWLLFQVNADGDMCLCLYLDPLEIHLELNSSSTRYYKNNKFHKKSRQSWGYTWFSLLNYNKGKELFVDASYSDVLGKPQFRIKEVDC